MALVGVVRTSLIQAAGTQDITDASVGFTPSAAIVFASHAHSAGAKVEENCIIGFASGTQAFCSQAFGVDVVATTDEWRHTDTENLLRFYDYQRNLQGTFALDTFIPNGMRITLTGTLDEPYWVHCIFFDAVQSSITQVNTTAPFPQTVSQGFEPDLVFVTNHLSINLNIIENISLWSFGAALNDGADTNKSIHNGRNHNVGTSDVDTVVAEDHVAGYAFQGFWDGRYLLNNFTATSFDIAPYGGDSIAGTWHNFLALQFPAGTDLSLFDVTLPSATDYVETAPGFQPEFGMVVHAVGPTQRNVVAQTGTGTFSATAFTDSQVWSQTNSNLNVQTTTVAKSASYPLLAGLKPVGNQIYNAGTPTFTPTGWSTSWITVPDSDVLGFGLAIAESGAVTEAAISGSVVPTAEESEIVTGGQTIDITLTNDTWVTPFNDTIRQAIIDGLDSDGVEVTGWNAEVRDKEVPSAVNRASNTLVRITLSASAAYAITTAETITVTVPDSALQTATSPVVGSPTFQITPTAAAGVVPSGLQNVEQQVMPFASTRLGGLLE